MSSKSDKGSIPQQEVVALSSQPVEDYMWWKHHGY